MLAIFAAGPAFQAPGSLAGRESRRELISKVATGAAFAAASVAQGASAKAGQFGKQELFGFASESPHERARSPHLAASPPWSLRSAYSPPPFPDAPLHGSTLCGGRG